MSAGAKVAILMGSGSDWPAIKDAYVTLRKFGVEAQVKVQSAHRTPDGAAG
ncbi:MAG: AIR carboxylase family protein, partial [Lentisphaerae bacterium]|nr:AIR carboxylase family protein [Lentisphaerota bacterium]